MSVIEDTRKLLQDFLAPELRELTARVDALENRMSDRFDTLERRMDARFVALDDHTDAADRLASERHNQTMQAITPNVIESTGWRPVAGSGFVEPVCVMASVLSSL